MVLINLKEEFLSFLMISVIRHERNDEQNRRVTA